eukprot:1807921-Amphidinium_carterae.1
MTRESKGHLQDQCGCTKSTRLCYSVAAIASTFKCLSIRACDWFKWESSLSTLACKALQYSKRMYRAERTVRVEVSTQAHTHARRRTRSFVARCAPRMPCKC